MDLIFTKQKKIITVVIVIIIIGGAVGVYYWINLKISAFEGISKSYNIAKNWKNDAVLNGINSGYGELDDEGKSTSWEYTYLSPSSIGINTSMQYNAMTIRVYASGDCKITYKDSLTFSKETRSRDNESNTSNITDIKLNLSIDSDAAYKIGLSDELIHEFSSRYFGFDAWMEAKDGNWFIGLDTGYGPDRGHQMAFIWVNGNTGEIIKSQTSLGNIDPWHWEYNFYKYQNEIIVTVVIVCLIIILLVSKRLRRHQNQSQKEQEKKQ